MASFVDGYRDWLLERDYSLATVINSLIALGHLGRRMERNHIGVERLDGAAVGAFVAGQDLRWAAVAREHHWPRTRRQPPPRYLTRALRPCR
jgi:hypothetical protein